MQRFNIHGLFVVYFVGVKVGFQGDALKGHDKGGTGLVWGCYIGVVKVADIMDTLDSSLHYLSVATARLAIPKTLGTNRRDAKKPLSLPGCLRIGGDYLMGMKVGQSSVGEKSS